MPDEEPIDWALSQRLRLEAEGFPKGVSKDAEAFLFGWGEGSSPEGDRLAYEALRAHLIRYCGGANLS